MSNEKKIVQHGHDYVERVERARQRSGMTQSQFGYVHFGDPGVLARLREGKRLYQPTVDKIERVLALFDEGA
jgi:transcriptional regulator with XRE-family HTH domain